MSEDDKQAGGSYGQLMEYLLSERHHFTSEEEFRAFAVGEVRRFINDLREFEIELTMRPNYIEKAPWHYDD
jgi:hypothetical protein